MVMSYFRSASFSLFIVFILGICGCTKSDSDQSSSSVSQPEVGVGALVAQCGAVIEGQLENPVAKEKAAVVSIEPVAPDLVIATLEQDFTEIGKVGDRFLIKLQGVSAGNQSSGKEQRGLALLNSNRFGVSFVPAGKQCSTRLANGGVAFVGQLFARTRLQAGGDASLSEALLELGSVIIDPKIRVQT